jgi:ribonuclease J
MTKSKDLYFLPLGGSGEIGMNLNLYRYGDKYLMVDCGVTFDDYLGIDVILPDTQFIEKHKDKLLGLILTHGHEDHIGAVPYLWRKFECPIYTTPFTAALLRHKLQEAGLIDEVSLVDVPIGGEVQLGPFDVEFVHLTHSIPEPNALAIKTPAGTVFHTGDWKLDDDPLVGRSADIERLDELGKEGVLALVCDSTNVFVEGHTPSESSIRENIINLVKEQKGAVAIGLFASNVARLETCALAAQASGRQPVLAGWSLQRMYQSARETGYLMNVPDFIDIRDAGGIARDKMLLICTGSQGEPRAALSRIANKNHPVVSLGKGDTVIFSSRKIPGNEIAISGLQNKLRALGVEIIVDYGSGIHVSGHPAQGELKAIYKHLKPKIVVPVHGEQMHMHAQAALAKEEGIEHAIVPHNGSLIRLSGERPEIVEEVPSGRLGLDGLRLVALNSNHLRERAKVMREGLVAITVGINKHKELSEPQIQFVGLSCNANEEAALQKLTKKELAKIIADHKKNAFESEVEVKDVCRMAARRAVGAIVGHKPFVVTTVVQLD